MKEKVYEFDQIFKALGDKHRLQILNMLLEKERNAGEILEAVDVVQSTLSHHMKSLSESGLVKVRKSGKWTYYSVSQEAIQAAYDFLKQYLDGEKESAESDGTVKVKTVSAAETGTKNEKAEEGKKAGKVPKAQKAQKSEKDTVMSHQSANSEDIFASAEAKKSSKKEHEDVFQASSVKEKSAEKDGASKKKKGGKSKKEKKKKDKK